jgi:uncharacterized protein YsxB (DUF464 family)
MIKISLSENENHFKLECTGHSLENNEPCARVSTALDMMKLFFTKHLEKTKRVHGLTLLVFNKKGLTKEKKKLLEDCILYFYELKKLYGSSIQIYENNEVKDHG